MFKKLTQDWTEVIALQTPHLADAQQSPCYQSAFCVDTIQYKNVALENRIICVSVRFPHKLLAVINILGDSVEP